ncbi:MAG: hypothetical protein AB1772_02060 [Candidatus Zixiibacteriota bacterium]
MKPLAKRTRLILLGVIVFGAGLSAVIEISGWQTLNAVTLDGEPIENPRRKLGLDPDASVVKQPFKSVAKLLLLNEQTARVDIEIDLPSSINIHTNRFTPVCLVLDRAGGRMLGLNYGGRTVPLREDFGDWEHPIITGANAGKIFERCEDPRVALIVPQLKELSDENRRLYRLIEEVDLSSPAHVEISVSGLAYRLKVTAEGFLDQITGFFEFLEGFESPIDSSRLVDLRFANLIVQTTLPDTVTSNGDTMVVAEEQHGR